MWSYARARRTRAAELIGGVLLLRPLQQRQTERSLHVGDAAFLNELAGFRQGENSGFDVLILVGFCWVVGRLEAGQLEEDHQLIAVAGGGIPGVEPFDPGRDLGDLFVALANGCLFCRLAGVDAAGGELPEPFIDRVAILAGPASGSE